MTVSNPNVKDTYAGNGSTTVFPFTFDLNVNDGGYVGVYVTDDEGYSQTVTNYTIDTSAKTVTYPTSGSPLASGKKISIRRELPNVQDLNLVNLGEFFAEDIEAEYDYVVMLIQQLAEICSRAITTDMASNVTPVQLLQEIRDNLAGAITAKNEAQTSANAAAASATSAANSATTTAGYKASVESTVNTFNATVTAAVNSAVTAATAQAGNYATAASNSATAAANSANAAAQSAQQGESVLASAAQYARQAAEDAAGIHASAIPAWDENTVYSYPDVVAYTDGGTYRCIGEDVEAGTLPTDRDNWVLTATVNGDDFFEIDLWGGLQPREYPSYSSSWELDGDDNITTKGA